MRWIRWSGLISFLIIIGAVLSIWWLLAAPLIKTSIEHYGSEAVGAKVNVADVALAIQPFGFLLHELSVADPDQPMQNLFEFDRAEAKLDLLKLLWGQIIIDEITIHQVQLETPRRVSGALPASQTKEQRDESESKDKELDMFDDMSIDLPSADDILKKEPLLTEKRKKEWDRLYAAEKRKLADISDKLPDKAKIARYKQEVKAITKDKIKSLDDFKQRQKRLKQLKRDIKQDRKNLKTAKDQYKQSYNKLTRQLKLLREAPGEDWQHLKSKYSLDEMGASNLSRLLFGDSVTQISKKALYWYDKAKPFIGSSEDKDKEQVPDRLDGRYIHFHSDDPTPDFLIRNAKLDLQLPMGQFAIRIEDITHQPEIIGRPTLLHLKGEKLDKIRTVIVEGVFDHSNPVKSSDNIQYIVQGLQLENMTISRLPITLAAAQADVRGDLFYQDQIVGGQAKAKFQQADFVSEAKEGLAKELGKALDNIQQFTLQANIKGAMGDVAVDIKSDLDRQIKAAVSKRLKQKEKDLQKKLKRKLDNKLKTYLAGNSEKLGGLSSQQIIMDGQLSQLDDLLKQKLDDHKKQEKRKAEDKLKNKLREKLSL